MAKIKGFSWIMHPPGGKENKEMKVMKRVLASSLCAALILSGAPSAMLGSTGLALFEGLGVAPQKAYAIEPASEGWYSTENENANYSFFYANGHSVIIDTDGDAIMMYPDDNGDGELQENEKTYAATLSNAPDPIKKIRIYAGSNTWTDEGREIAEGRGEELVKITMKDGNIDKIVGADDGPGSMTASEIDIEGGYVRSISMHETSKIEQADRIDRTFENSDQYSVRESVINIYDGEVGEFARGTYSYSSVETGTINVYGGTIGARTPDSYNLITGSNGRIGDFTINIYGGKVYGPVSGGQRTLVDSYTLNFLGGDITGAIYAGSYYPESSTYEGSNEWDGLGFGDIEYGVVSKADINIGENAGEYHGVFAGSQSFSNDVKAIYTKFYESGNDNVKYIIENFGLSAEDGKIESEINITVEKESAATAGHGNSMDLLKTAVDGVTVKSAAAELKVSPEKVKLNTASPSNAPKTEANVKAEVKLIAPVASASSAPITWTSSDTNVAAVSAENEAGTEATITAGEVGAATITASFASELDPENPVEAHVQVSVGGDFDINVTPADIRLGDTITFTAGRLPASSSDAPERSYEWSVDDRVAEMDADGSNGKSMKATAIAVGNGTASLTYYDEEGNDSNGNVAFTVTPPTVSLTAPEEAEVGDTIRLNGKIENINSSNEEIMNDVNLMYLVQGGCLEEVEDGRFLVTDVPEDSMYAKVHAAVTYPTAEGTEEATSDEEDIMITLPSGTLDREFLLNTETPERTINLTGKVARFVKEGRVEVVNENEELLDLEVDDVNGKLNIAIADGVEGNNTATITFLLPSHADIAKFTVNIEAGNSQVIEGNVGVEITADTVYPEAPEGVDQAEVTALTDEAFTKVRDGIKYNAALESEEALSNLANAVVNQGLIAEGETASVSLDQVVTGIKFETLVDTDEEGNQTVRVVPRSITFEIDAYKTPIDENGVYGEKEKLDLGSDSIKRRTYFSFRIPVPAVVSERYVNLIQDGESLGQFTIRKTDAGDGYIDVRVWHLSTFELTFTNERQSSGSSGGGSVTGAGVYYADGRSAVAAGTWTQDANGWKYVLANGSYPVNAWYECEWNGQKLWYHFGAEGYADSGWFTDTDGNTYYLHPDHDGNFGYMYTGWNLIGGKNYFFSTGTWDGLPKGALFKGTTTPDGHRVGADGAWDGVN